MGLQITHVELKQANAFVASLHRHHDPVVGHRYSIGVQDSDGKLVGVAIVGRPVARAVDASTTVEVTRLCTDGTKNACSILYAACARAAKELGYKKIQTYILASEPGTTLVAAGWTKEADVYGREWDCPSRRRRTTAPTEAKERWAKQLS